MLDKKPRHLTEQQKETLQYLADITIDQIELRLAARTAIYQQNQVLSMAAHDLKNPLTTLSVWAQLTSEAKNNPEEVEKFSERIKEAANKMNKLVNDLLGQGLTVDDKKNLYQRFVKLSAEPTGGESSTGLGLSIVKSIVDAHHGEINVESEGKFMGATFTVKLPLVKNS